MVARDTLRLWGGIILMAFVVIGGPYLIFAWYNIAFVEGVETTVTGSIQLHQLKYSRFWRLDYTNCEMRTYSGDTHHIELRGHIELEYGKTYRITFVARNYWLHLKLVNEAVTITQLEDVEA